MTNKMVPKSNNKRFIWVKSTVAHTRGWHGEWCPNCDDPDDWVYEIWEIRPGAGPIQIQQNSPDWIVDALNYAYFAGRYEGYERAKKEYNV